MEKISITVDGMSCDHCVRAVTKAVGGLSGVANVDVNLNFRLVTVEYDPAQTSLDAIKAEIEDQGYDVVS